MPIMFFCVDFYTIEYLLLHDFSPHFGNIELNKGAYMLTPYEMSQLKNDELRGTDFVFNTNEDINEILRGERAATHAYEQVLSLIEKPVMQQRLTEIKAEHVRAQEFWKKQIDAQEMVPDLGPSVWGGFVGTYVEFKKMFGVKSALKGLLEGERHGENLYKKMLDRSSMNRNQKNKIIEIFIPRQRRHINHLKAFIALEDA